MLWNALESVLEPGTAGRQEVLDFGGGTAEFAVRVADLGHRVTVVDPSPDGVAALQRRAAEAGVEIDGHVGDLFDLGEFVEPGSVDVLLCHEVLESVEDPAAALAALAQVLRPGGTLSLLVAQRHAEVVARAMAGEFQVAGELLAGADVRRGEHGRTTHWFTLDEVEALVDGAGLERGPAHGVRVFADRVPGPLLDLDPESTAALVELEQAASTRPEYLPLASQLHVLATR